MSITKLAPETQQRMIKKTLNFRQAGETYRAFSESERTNLISNFAGDLNQVKNVKVKEQIVAHAYAADVDYGTRLAKATNVNLATAEKIAAKLNDDPKKNVKLSSN